MLTGHTFGCNNAQVLSSWKELMSKLVSGCLATKKNKIILGHMALFPTLD
jgi:hypothetical protein